MKLGWVKAACVKNQIWSAKSIESDLLISDLKFLGIVPSERKDSEDVWKSNRKNWQN
jgi:hypothetical protein